MAKFYPFPKIGNYLNTIHTVTETTRFNGFNTDGTPIYDQTKLLPTIKFNGSVKVHGTNAGIGYDPETNTLWAQSREHMLSEKSTNAGFHTYVMSHKEYFIETMSKISSSYPVIVYGEWCGSNIQKGVAISTLQKRLIIFAAKIITDERNPIWLTRSDIELFFSPEKFLWNIYVFDRYEIEIDFNHPEASQNKLNELTYAVEKECPVGRYFGKYGVGEGIVWANAEYGRFKVKGLEHCSSHITSPAAVSGEKIASINEFVSYAVTENRLNQGIEQVFSTHNEDIDIKHIKKFLNWITNDISKEESSTLIENNLLPEDVAKAVKNKARIWFVEKFNSNRS